MSVVSATAQRLARDCTRPSGENVAAAETNIHKLLVKIGANFKLQYG